MRSQLSCSEGSLIFSFCPDHPHGVKIHDGQGLPWWFSGWDSILRLLESQVQSLVRAGELRSCLLHGMAKNQKKKKKRFMMVRVRAGTLTAEQCRQESFLCWKKKPHPIHWDTLLSLVWKLPSGGHGQDMPKQVHMLLASSQIRRQYSTIPLEALIKCHLI